MNATSVQVIARLLAILRLCRAENVRFSECMAEARRRHNRELREQALTAALDELA